MKNSWTKTFRRLAAACAVAGSTALSSAACYAAAAMDSASDPVYADGWQAGDNGGTGFTPWNFDAGYIFAGTNYTYASPLYAQIDDGLQGGTQFSNPHNAIGRSWAIGASHQANEGSIHIGRGFTPLGIGQTLKVVFDNPTESPFFKGYFVRLNGGTGGTNGNICNLGYGCSHPNFPDGYPVGKNNLSRFEYFNFGEWNLYDGGPSPDVNVFDTDTSAAGAIYKVTRTGADSYDVSLDSIGPGADFSASRTFDNAGVPVDWIEFVFFNADDRVDADPNDDVGFSDLTPTLAEPGTDLYIRSIMIVPEPGTAALLLLGAGGILLARARRRTDA
jgi:hypothetical protein